MQVRRQGSLLRITAAHPHSSRRTDDKSTEPWRDVFSLRSHASVARLVFNRMRLHSIRREMRSQVVLAGALLALISACGGGDADPASARCPAPPATFGRRVVLSDHAEIAIHYKCEGASIGGTLYLPKNEG